MHVLHVFLCLAEKQWVLCTVHEIRKYFFQQKIILLQYFQFSAISGIQIDPKY